MLNEASSIYCYRQFGHYGFRASWQKSTFRPMNRPGFARHTARTQKCLAPWMRYSTLYVYYRH